MLTVRWSLQSYYVPSLSLELAVAHGRMSQIQVHPVQLSLRSHLPYVRTVTINDRDTFKMFGKAKCNLLGLVLFILISLATLANSENASLAIETDFTVFRASYSGIGIVDARGLPTSAADTQPLQTARAPFPGLAAIPSSSPSSGITSIIAACPEGLTPDEVAAVTTHASTTIEVELVSGHTNSNTQASVLSTSRIGNDLPSER